MGSLCSSPDENQVDRTPVEAPLVLWGDVVNSESRIVMSLLAMAKIRYQFQQVSTPEDDIDDLKAGRGGHQPVVCKEDWLDIPEDLSKLKRAKRVTGRSVFIGERDSFFHHISTTYTDASSQLMPPE